MFIVRGALEQSREQAKAAKQMALTGIRWVVGGEGFGVGMGTRVRQIWRVDKFDGEGGESWFTVEGRVELHLILVSIERGVYVGSGLDQIG